MWIFDCAGELVPLSLECLRVSSTMCSPRAGSLPCCPLPSLTPCSCCGAEQSLLIELNRWQLGISHESDGLVNKDSGIGQLVFLMEDKEQNKK